MRHTPIGRLGLLAVGLGIGAALAATGTASANPAITSPPVDPTTLTAAVEGMTLGTPSADPAAVELPPFDPNNFAVSVYGIPLFHEGSAAALSTFGNIAIADGTNAYAQSESGAFFSFDLFDFASAFGANSTAKAFGIADAASAVGANSEADAVGNYSAACVLGPNADAQAVGDGFNFASILNTGSGSDQALAGITTNAFPGLNMFDIASVVGTDSTALAGADFNNPGSFDLAAAFGDMLHAVATGGNFLVDIQP